MEPRSEYEWFQRNIHILLFGFVRLALTLAELLAIANTTHYWDFYWLKQTFQSMRICTYEIIS